MRVDRRERPGTLDVTDGFSALRALASKARRTPGSSDRRPGEPKTRPATCPQSGHAVASVASAIGRTNSNAPPAEH